MTTTEPVAVGSFAASVSVHNGLTARITFTGKVGGKLHRATLFIDVTLPPADAPVKPNITFPVTTPTGKSATVILNWIDDCWEVRVNGLPAGVLYADNCVTVGVPHGYIDPSTQNMRDSDISG